MTLSATEQLKSSPNFEVLTFRDNSCPSPRRAASQNSTAALASPQHDATRDARIAVFESPYAPPRVVSIPFTEPADYIETITSTTHSLCQQMQTNMPYTIIKALVENFIHADFIEPSITITNRGKTLTFANQGKAIRHKKLALTPGFSSATAAIKQVIAGVGSGLPTVLWFAENEGGSLAIEDNLTEGCVVTLSLEALPQKSEITQHNTTPASCISSPLAHASSRPPHLQTSLSERQNEVLVVVADYHKVGPSQISDLLGVSLATAYRDLALLERRNLVLSSEGGKRSITTEGKRYLDEQVFQSLQTKPTQNVELL